MDGQLDEEDLKLAISRAEMLLTMIGSGSFDIDLSRNLVGGKGIDPAAVRDIVRSTTGAHMTPPPDRHGEHAVALDGWSDDGGLVRTPIWTEVGRAPLDLLITVVPKYLDTTSYRLWSYSVSGVIDEHGRTVLTPAEAPAPAWPYPDWTEPRAGKAADDPRIPRAAFTGESYGIRFGQLLNGIRRVHPDVLAALDDVNEGQAAIVMLDSFFSQMYGDGIVPAYQRLDVDGAPRLLASAAGLTGASAHAELFAELALSFPAHVGESSSALRSYLDDLEDAAWDAGDEGRPLLAYEDRLFQMEDDGDAVWGHMERYVESHPDQFFTPE